MASPVKKTSARNRFFSKILLLKYIQQYKKPLVLILPGLFLFKETLYFIIGRNGRKRFILLKGRSFCLLTLKIGEFQKN